MKKEGLFPLTDTNYRYFDEYTNTPVELNQIYNNRTGKYNYQLTGIVDKKTREPVIDKRTGEQKYKTRGKPEYRDKYQVCHYSNNCNDCDHKQYCILKENNGYELEEDINYYMNKINEYDTIIDAYERKDEIIYHEDFDTYYNIKLYKHENGVYGIESKITNKNLFLKAVRTRKKTLSKFIKDLQRERAKIEHQR